MSKKIYPVIMCGGTGTRLWPLSRKSFPKQFSKLTGNNSLLQDTVQRLTGPAFKAPILLTNNEFRFTVGEQMAQISVTPEKIIIEPSVRNTAPAIAAAALCIQKLDPDAVLLVAPSDHVLTDEASFAESVKDAAVAARAGKIVTFGVKPTHPETGYGYIELKNKAQASEKVVPFEKFVEKPDRETAIEMVKSGRYFWNSGMFIFSAKSILAAFEEHAPEVLNVVKQAVDDGASDLDFFRLAEAYEKSPNVSIDFAVMERVEGQMVPLDAGWNDVGNWKTVWSESERDADGVALGERATAINCNNTLLRSEQKQVQVVGIGLNNIVAVAMRDAVLIADLDEAQNVKLAVDSLRNSKVAQAEDFQQCHRPWGWYETLALGRRFQVKEIMVKPGAQLSLQSHVHRAEHWVVVEGTATVTVDEEVKLLSENESIYIPLGAVHRLENPGKVDLHLIEVQTGSYLGEDDIIRYEDVYARV